MPHYNQSFSILWYAIIHRIHAFNLDQIPQPPKLGKD